MTHLSQSNKYQTSAQCWINFGAVSNTMDQRLSNSVLAPRVGWRAINYNTRFLLINEMKWNELGFRPPLCTYRLNWARRTSWGWWDDWDDTVLQTQDSKLEPWRSEAEHATSRSRRLPTILTFTRGWGRNIFVSFKPPRPGTEPRTLAWKAAVLTTTLGPPPLLINIIIQNCWELFWCATCVRIKLYNLKRQTINHVFSAFCCSCYRRFVKEPPPPRGEDGPFRQIDGVFTSFRAGNFNDAKRVIKRNNFNRRYW